MLCAVAGTEAGRDGNGGALLFFDRQRMEFVRRIAMNASVSALIWHERLNQIFVGTGVNGPPVVICTHL